MQYKKGDRVKHPKKPDWGIGQVLADSTGGTVRIFFTHAGEKTMSLDFVQPEKLSGDAASSPILGPVESGRAAHQGCERESSLHELRRADAVWRNSKSKAASIGLVRALF